MKIDTKELYQSLARLEMLMDDPSSPSSGPGSQERLASYIIDGCELFGGGMCPEQYDVYLDGVQIGYLRLRHGTFRADYPDVGGETVYRVHPKGGGWFMDDEREKYLAEAVVALKAHRSMTEQERLASTPSSEAATEPPQDWKDIFYEYRALGRTDAWLYQQIEAHSRRTSARSAAEWYEDMRKAWEREKQRADRLERELAQPANAATPWDQCQFDIISWEIDHGRIGISVKHGKGCSAWAMKPNEHVESLLRDGLRYRYLRGYTTDYSEMAAQALCAEAMDEWIDKKMANAAECNHGT